MNRAFKRTGARTAAVHPLRQTLVLAVVLTAMGLIVVRAIYLQVWHASYLQEQGNARYLRVVEDAPHRGMILDRNGEPLAISTPVDSVWAQPAELQAHRDRWPELLALLGMERRELATLIQRHAGREFMYLKRHVPPELAERVVALKVPSVALQREHRRYYPQGAVAGHVVGFTNIDDQGQEGLELVYDAWLQGVPGKKRVFKDRLGNLVETVESVALPVPGRDLVTSLDRRIQYLAYRELKAAVVRHKASGGAVVVLDARTGEVLALVNEPGFNPNNRTQRRDTLFRNRAVTDVFEPGSTLKPFTVAAALHSGKFRAQSVIDTAPGVFQVGPHLIRDMHDYGRLTLGGVIQKSSNVGAAKIALGLDKAALWQVLRQAGVGSLTGSGLPGESAGVLHPAKRWVPVDHANMAFGYGVSVTALQLARAYTVFANQGVLAPVSLLRRDGAADGGRVLPAAVATAVRAMLEQAVTAEGTGAAAKVAYYRVAGKTGTAHKLSTAGPGYGNDYIASFAGLAPASDPRLVMVVMIDTPVASGHFGGEVAAPVFSKVMAGSLRLLNIAPDDTPAAPVRRLAHAAGEAG